MGTRSMIGIEVPGSKRVKSVYCHWDGYLSHNGYILENFYNSSPKVNNLIALGDISSLGSEIGTKVDFDAVRDKEDYIDNEAGVSIARQCLYYTRDRGEDAPFKSFDSAAKAVSYYDGSWCEYFYLYRYDDSLESGKWYFRTRSEGRWKRLSKALPSALKEMA